MASVARPLALVTGASDGIGYELARQFATHDYDLVLCADDAGIAEAGQAFESMGSQVTRVRADLATSEGVEQLYASACALGRPVDAAALNAGAGLSGDFTRENDVEAEKRIIALNVTSQVHLAKLLLPDMVQRGSGRLLITSSVAALMPAPFNAVYGASKAFLYSFAQAIRNELKDTGVTVTVVLPDPTDTGFFRRAGMEDTKVGADEKKEDPSEIAREAFDALMAGKDQVIAGAFKHKLQAIAAMILPETVKAQYHRTLNEPGSAGR